MSDASATGNAVQRVLRQPRFWFGPAVVVTVLMGLLAALYLGSILKPQENLHHFPIALVNQDEGDTVPGNGNAKTQQNFGQQIETALSQGIDPNKIDLQHVGIAEAQARLANGKVYGAILIPSDFTKRMVILAQASVVPGTVDKPVITVLTNPRAGTFASAIVTTIGQQAAEKVNASVGAKLTAQVEDVLKAGPAPTQLSGASRLTLAQPVNVIVTAYNPLPDGTGNGLSAFYYTILLLLAGFTGAMIIHTMVDSYLGFVPTEYGPLYVHQPAVGISRFNTLLLKWGIMFVVANIVSGVYVGIGHLLGMPITKGLALFIYGAFAVTAVGITAMSVLALLGSAGLLVNLVVFIVLGLPSSGGTVPVEATPPFFGWLARFEPMHQVYLGVRAILYFDARGNAGLIASSWATLCGLLIGVVLGILATKFYDRRGFERRPGGFVHDHPTEVEISAGQP
ncbi:DUF3533 domain-containing protein [Skermania sp. ID1734]|uniref:YhgE/Pip domain-containing protein n=1 Tax=Skermania sp. ID1734 TaxID=2597516 RepID=UPI00117D18AA|nr:DUF3533 domain-containing protein [Skermania sp. ID1734]TSD96538.1 DUF3533 domain-containing protein [Skermania sp. ID1734]